jgi:hypothetical protein
MKSRSETHLLVYTPEIYTFESVLVGYTEHKEKRCHRNKFSPSRSLPQCFSAFLVSRTHSLNLVGAADPHPKTTSYIFIKHNRLTKI